MKILMVCLGNICRSPIAEGVLQYYCYQNNLNWQIDSAGTNGYHIGEAPHKYSQQVCLQHGIDINKQRSRRFTKSDFDEYDIIYAMAIDIYKEIEKVAQHNKQMDKVQLILQELPNSQNLSVPDPWYGDKDGYLPVFILIQNACKAIIKNHANITIE